MTEPPAPATPAPGPEGTVFWVELPAFRGPLEKLVSAAQRGDVDLTAIPVADITGRFRRLLASAELRPPLGRVADFLTLAARLVALKAAALLPENAPVEAEEGLDPATEAGRRLAEHRLFSAAVDSLLSDAEEGYRSFLGLVSPDVVPVERLRVSPERLVAALRAVVERLAEVEPLPLGVATFSVRELGTRLRRRLAGGATVPFEELFTGITARLEAVACFLALLELLNAGEASVDQDEPFGTIMVTGRA